MKNVLLLSFLCISSLTFAQRGYNLSGTVQDANTGKPIAGASIYILETGGGGITDSTGQFFFPLSSAYYGIQVSAVGYRSIRERVNMNESKTITIKLDPKVLQLEEVEVRAGREDRNVKSVEMSKIQLSIQQIKRIPVVFGETDILKALTLQPGVTTVGEGAGGFNVRGGRVDQNLVLLDGAPLFSTSHLLGFLSSINPDIVQDITLYKGGIPASYGGRLSSLLTMGVRPGQTDRWHFTGGIGPLTARFAADGPLIKNKLTLLVGGRVAYPNWIMHQFPAPTNQNKAFFYDLNAKLLWTPNANHRISLSAYRSYDEFKFPQDTIYYGASTLVSGSWNGRFGPALSVGVQAFQSDYTFGNQGIKQYLQYDFRAGIQQREAKVFALWSPSEALKLETGGSLTHYQTTPGDLTPTNLESSVRRFVSEKEQGREGAGYVSGEWTAASFLTIQAGLRYVQYQNIGPGQVFGYESGTPRSVESIADTLRYTDGQVIRTYGGFEPRLGLRLGLGKQNALKLSYNRMRQYLHLISNTTAISPVDFWKLADPFIPPQLANQWAAGLFHNSKDNDYEVGVESYYKKLSNLVEYRNGANLILNPALETDLLRAEGYAYGVEASVQKTKGRLTGQLAYTYARTFTRVLTDFPDQAVNQGRWYPSYNDRPHNLAVTLQYQLGNRWTFSTNFVYITGRPATFPDGVYRINDTPVVNYSQRNLDRIPDTHRLDISFIKSTRKTSSQPHYSTWVVGVYNAYGRKNPYSVYFTRYNTLTRSYQLAVFGAPIPSLSYNFYW